MQDAPSRETNVANTEPAVDPILDIDDDYSAPRAEMVDQQLRRRDIVDVRLLEAMGRIPRHLFVPDVYHSRAYGDHPLPIGHGQTISQPYIVALMTQLTQTRPTAKALDVGTGSGYQAAVLGKLIDRVYSIEILPELANTAYSRLQNLSYENITLQGGDGYQGWPEHAPFDVIIVAAAAKHVPQPLVDQLAPEGRLVLPVGQHRQQLMVLKKKSDGNVIQENVAAVAFVPMTGEADPR